MNQQEQFWKQTCDDLYQKIKKALDCLQHKRYGEAHGELFLAELKYDKIHLNEQLQPPNSAPAQGVEEAVFLLRKLQPDNCPNWKEDIGDCENMECNFCRIEKCINALENGSGWQQGQPVGYQSRVNEWMENCFGEAISKDIIERNYRFFEEATELVQSTGMKKEECQQLIDYVFDRPVGETIQEVGGVAVTLAALCNAVSINQNEAAELELTRVWRKISKIREKQKNKPKFSPLPQQPAPTIGAGWLKVSDANPDIGEYVEVWSNPKGAHSVTNLTITQFTKYGFESAANVTHWRKIIPPSEYSIDQNIDHAGEREVMIMAFDKVHQLFEHREWIIEGRGSYPYGDDRYKQEVRYLFDEFRDLHAETFRNIKSKTFEYRKAIIDAYQRQKSGENKNGKAEKS